MNTVIFDIGNVLAYFNWRETYAELFEGEELEQISQLTVMDSEGWNALDQGIISYDEAVEAFSKKSPELRDKIRLGMDTIYQKIEAYPYASRWVQKWKDRGYKVYALSNYGEQPFLWSRPRFDFMELMDGAVISYELKLLKPGEEIYKAICNKYGIVPEQAAFVDDNPANIEAANKLGFNGVLFSNHKQADEELERLAKL